MGKNNLIPNTMDCSSLDHLFLLILGIHGNNQSTGISNHSTPLSGDIDGDGNTEILIME